MLQTGAYYRQPDGRLLTLKTGGVMPSLRAVVILVAATAGLAVSQPRAVVFDFQPVGVELNTARAATVLLRDRLTDVGAFTVVAGPPETPAYTVDEAVKAAALVNAQKAVIGSITRLGAKLIIAYKLVDVASGLVEFSDRANLSSSDELDIATERMARALKEKKAFVVTGEVGKMTETEKRRTTALSSIFLTTGYTTPLYHEFPYDPGWMLFTLDASVTYETPNILAQGLMGLRRGKWDYNELYFDLLVHRMFSTLDVSPYIGGGIGVHRFSQHGVAGPGEDDGLAFVASGGLVLFRTQYFRLLAGLKATATFTEDFGTPIVMGSFNFGLSSPTVGPNGVSTDGLSVPSPCIYGCIGAFFLTGLIVALST
jgi:hypothetical protein